MTQSLRAQAGLLDLTHDAVFLRDRHLSRLHSTEVYDRSIDVQILRLRRKIEDDPADPQLIRTERGAGYVFCAPVATVR